MDYIYLFISERGKFLALDLGGTNFRVLLILLGENKHFDMKSKIYAIPQSIMLGSGTQVSNCLSCLMSTSVKLIKLFILMVHLSF